MQKYTIPIVSNINFRCLIVLTPKASHPRAYSRTKIPINTFRIIFSVLYFVSFMLVVYRDMSIMKRKKRITLMIL